MAITMVEPTQEFESQALTLKDQAQELKVFDLDTYAMAGELGKGLKELRSKVVDYFEDPKKAAAIAHKKLCALEASELKPIDEALNIIRDSMNAYTREQERIRHAEEAKKRRENDEKAAKERERLLAMAAKADAKGRTEKVEELMEAAENVYAAPVTVETIAKTVTTESGKITQAAEIKITVVDVRAFTAELVKRGMAPTMIEIKAAPLKAWVKANGLESFPGLAIQKTTGVRF